MYGQGILYVVKNYNCSAFILSLPGTLEDLDTIVSTGMVAADRDREFLEEEGWS